MRVWALALALLAGAVAGNEYSYTVRVPAARMECYYQNVTDPKFAHMEIDFQVIDGGDLNINFMVINPAQTTVAQFLRRSDGTQRLELGIKGDYQVCFDNSFSYQQDKTVFFEIFLYDKDGNLDDGDFDDYDGLVKLDGELDNFSITQEEFKTTSTKIKNNLNKAEHCQALLRAWENRDYAIMNSNLKRVDWWSVLNTAVLLLVGTVQVYMIRSLFEDNSKMGKILRQRT